MNDAARQQLQQASELIRNEAYEDAFGILADILNENQDNKEAWWLMANAVATPDEAHEALEQVLRLDPDHAPARDMLDQLSAHYPTPPETPPSPDEEPQVSDDDFASIFGDDEEDSEESASSLFDQEAEDDLESLFGESDASGDALASLFGDEPDDDLAQLLGDEGEPDSDDEFASLFEGEPEPDDDFAQRFEFEDEDEPDRDDKLASIFGDETDHEDKLASLLEEEVKHQQDLARPPVAVAAPPHLPEEEPDEVSPIMRIKAAAPPDAMDAPADQAQDSADLDWMLDDGDDFDEDEFDDEAFDDDELEFEDEEDGKGCGLLRRVLLLTLGVLGIIVVVVGTMAVLNRQSSSVTDVQPTDVPAASVDEGRLTELAQTHGAITTALDAALVAAGYETSAINFRFTPDGEVILYVAFCGSAGPNFVEDVQAVMARAGQEASGIAGDVAGVGTAMLDCNRGNDVLYSVYAWLADVNDFEIGDTSALAFRESWRTLP